MRSFAGVLFLICAACVAFGQDAPELRYVNGTPVKGEVIAVRPDGIEVKSGASARVYPWTAFSAGTRFRFDPLFRANLAAAQQGHPATAWNQPPDGGYEIRPASGPVSGLETSVAPIRAMSLAALPSIPARARSSLAGLELRESARAVTWGFRYGPGEADAVYMVLEPAADDGLPAQLLLWTQPDKRPERLTGSRRADREEATVSFRKQRFRASREGVEVQYDLGVSMSTRDPGVIHVALDVELKQGSRASAFTLIGAPPGALTGDGNVLARDLLSTPSLKMSVEPAEGQPVVAGNVRMGRLRLIPRAGMDKAVMVQIADSRQSTVLEEALPVQEGLATDKFSFVLPLGRLTASQKYALQARIDLGPFLGPLTYAESFVRP